MVDKAGMRTLGKSVAIVGAFACFFAINYFFVIQHFAYVEDAFAAGVAVVATLAVIIWIGLTSSLSARTTAVAVLVGCVLQLSLSSFEGLLPSLVSFMPLITSVVATIGSVFSGALFYFMPKEKCPQSFLVGFAMSAAMVALLRTFTSLDDSDITKVLFALAICFMLAYLAFEKNGATQRFPQAIEHNPSVGRCFDYVKVNCSSRKGKPSNYEAIVVLISSLFYFGFGALEKYLIVCGADILPIASTAFIALGILLVFLLMSHFTSTVSMMRTMLLAIWISVVVSLLVALMAPEYLSQVYVVLGAFMMISNLPIRVVLMEDSIMRKISPVLWFALAILLLFICHITGHQSVAFLSGLLNDASLSISVAVVLVVAFAYILVLMIRSLSTVHEAEECFEDGGQSIALKTGAMPRADVTPEADAVSVVSFASIAARYHLTKREVEILDMYRQGRTAVYIASNLYLSESTIKTHIKHAYSKLGVTKKQQLIDFFQNDSVQ